MPYTVFISLGISAVLLILSLLFRLAGKFRLTLAAPLLSLDRHGSEPVGRRP